MAKFNLSNWQSKLDPHFDKVVRNYVKFLDERGQSPGEGRLNFPEELTGPLTDDTAWQGLDEPDVDLSILRFAKKTGLLDAKGFRNIIDFFNSIEDTDKTLKLSLKMLEALPEEESRAFYRKEFESFSGNKGGNSMDSFSLTLQLFMRYLSVKLESDGTETKQVDVDTEYIRESNVSSTLINAMSLMSSSLAHQKTLPILAEGIRKGDDKSLFKALTINKSLLYTK